MDPMTLYNYYRSSTSYRVRIALYYKKIAFEYKPVHLLMGGGEQYKQEYRQLNPMSEVPTLVHGKLTIAQSMAILEYLEELFPTPALLPKDSYLRAKIRQFCENINSFMHPINNLKILQYLEEKHSYDQKAKEGWVQYWMPKGFGATEKLLEEFSGKFCFGDELTLADLFLIPQVFTAQRFHVDLSSYPLIRKINDECLQLEAFVQAHPQLQIDAPKLI
ncbi:MAG: maleylacetoacetate isomerase [Bdellovibrionaceae bacterium]|nr:maleylacetoacetate isomerase [Pseudobdellovibrionaceae bacterium]